MGTQKFDFYLSNELSNVLKINIYNTKTEFVLIKNIKWEEGENEQVTDTNKLIDKESEIKFSMFWESCFIWTSKRSHSFFF